MSSARSRMKNTNFIMWLFGRSHLYRNNLKWKNKNKQNKQTNGKRCAVDTNRYPTTTTEFSRKKERKNKHIFLIFTMARTLALDGGGMSRKNRHTVGSVRDHETQRLRSLDSFISYGYDTSSMTTLSVFFYFFLFHQQPTGKTKTNKQKRMSRTDVE